MLKYRVPGYDSARLAGFLFWGTSDCMPLGKVFTCLLKHKLLPTTTSSPSTCDLPGNNGVRRSQRFAIPRDHKASRRLHKRCPHRRHGCWFRRQAPHHRDPSRAIGAVGIVIHGSSHRHRTRLTGNDSSTFPSTPRTVSSPTKQRKEKKTKTTRFSRSHTLRRPHSWAGPCRSAKLPASLSPCSSLPSSRAGTRRRGGWWSVGSGWSRRNWISRVSWSSSSSWEGVCRKRGMNGSLSPDMWRFRDVLRGGVHR